MRWRLVVDAIAQRDTPDGEQHIPVYLSSDRVDVYNDQEDEIEEQVDQAADTINRRLEDFQAQGSGFKLFAIERVSIHCSKHSPITGSSFIPTPSRIASRQAIVNIRNDDNFWQS